MSRNLVCDACGTTSPETDEEKTKWTIFRRGKLTAPSTHEKAWDVCPSCERQISSFIVRLQTDRPAGTA